MTDQQQPEPPRDPMAVSATGAFLGVEAPFVLADGRIVIPADLLPITVKR
jgi:hypothetical protein